MFGQSWKEASILSKESEIQEKRTAGGEKGDLKQVGDEGG